MRSGLRSRGWSAAALLWLPAVPAAATTHEVTVGPGFTFSPSALTVQPGDSVRFTNVGGTHNVHFDDGTFDQPASPSSAPWTAMITLAATGDHRYYCELHGGPGGVGMSGLITVAAPDPFLFGDGFETP
jgi:plastocyanin